MYTTNDHECTECHQKFVTEKDTAHTKYHLHMRRIHNRIPSFACHINCYGVVGLKRLAEEQIKTHVFSGMTAERAKEILDEWNRR